MSIKSSLFSQGYAIKNIYKIYKISLQEL